MCCHRCCVNWGSDAVKWQEEAEEEEVVILNKFATWQLMTQISCRCWDVCMTVCYQPWRSAAAVWTASLLSVPCCQLSTATVHTLRCLTLLEILEIYWKFTKSPGNSLWSVSRVHTLVVNISYNFCISECIGTEYLAVNQDQLILRLVIPGNCQLTHLLIG